jgi:biotin transport system substrate-specific component
MTNVALSTTRLGRTTALGILGFAIALACAAQVAVPIPGTPVPFTLQPLVVVLAGLWLGPWAGAASMILYLIAGAAGLPVFAPIGAPGIARFMGPTAGYLFAYPLSAFVAGWLGVRARGFAGRAGAAAAGIALLLLGGLAYLIAFTGTVSGALALGVHPFVFLDGVKALVAAALAPRRTSRAPA